MRWQRAQAKCADAIPVGRREAGVAIEISDDGVGGATGRVDPACGLTDRVEALHGLLLVTCPPGEGTVATAELLCAVAKR
jgi:signal transduction histidine kinase